MILSAEEFTLVASILLLLSVVLSKTIYRIGLPTLILFLFIGMFAGSDGPGGIVFENYKLAQFLGIIALIFILFDGGLSTKWGDIKPVVIPGAILATFGVLLTAIIAGTLMHCFTDFTFIEGMLIGSIASSTDASAVFSIFRSHNVGIKKGLRSLLEFESGSNDPMAYILTVICIYIIQKGGDISSAEYIWIFIRALALGTIAGLIFGSIAAKFINRVNLSIQGLYPVLVVSIAMLTYAITDVIGGNGYLAVYIAGVILGNSRFIHKKSIIKFHDGWAWLMQIVMFLTLGLLIYPKQLWHEAPVGIMISALMIFVVRPIAMFFVLAFFNIKFKEKLFISWVGLRGAVPIILSIYPLVNGIPRAQEMFHIVFFIAVTSLIIQGSTIVPVAHLLKLSTPTREKRQLPEEIEFYEDFKSELSELIVGENSAAVGKPIFELGLPKMSLIVLINRSGGYVMPQGTTVIEAKDKLLVMALNRRIMKRLKEVFA